MSGRNNSAVKVSYGFELGLRLAVKVAVAHDWIMLGCSVLYSKITQITQITQVVESGTEVSDWTDFEIGREEWQFKKKRLKKLAEELRSTMESIEA